jgi:glycosyltransferase involved in cell wall biosynthesis
MQNKKVAIYSGEIPSTTFIERLIDGLASSTTIIYLFGKQKEKTHYSKNVKIVSYSNQLSKILVLLKYTILLIIFKQKQKQKLDTIIAKQEGNVNNKKLKYYPVLYHKPDIFHLQWAKGIEDWLWVQEFGMKFVLSLRGTHISVSPIVDYDLKKSYESNFQKIDGFHAVSNAILEEAKKYEVHLKNASVIYSGLDLNKLPYKAKTKQNNTLQILSIGRSHWLKGYCYALDACSILKQEQIKFHYTIIGIENDEELIFQRNQLELGENVSFQKNISFEKVKEKIYESDIVLLPSLEEGIANVVLEAMQLGTLVLTTDCGGMNEVIINGTNGFIVPIRNPKKMADVIIEIMQLSEDEKNCIIDAAKKIIENNHTESKMINDMFALYQNVLKS